jgi:hypothetical protein
MSGEWPVGHKSPSFVAGGDAAAVSTASLHHGEEARRRLLRGRRRLGVAQRHQFAPQIAAPVDLDEAGQGPWRGNRAAYAAARSSSVSFGCRLCR